jgi:hypothetical protein
MSTLPVRNENGWVWIEDVDVVSAALGLHEYKTHVGLTCDTHYGVYINFFNSTRCEIDAGVGRDGEPVTYIYNYGDKPTEGTAYVAAEVFELVRLIPEIKKSVPRGSLEALGGLRAVLEAFRLRRLVMDYITKTRNAMWSGKERDNDGVELSVWKRGD